MLKSPHDESSRYYVDWLVCCHRNPCWIVAWVSTYWMPHWVVVGLFILPVVQMSPKFKLEPRDIAILQAIARGVPPEQEERANRLIAIMTDSGRLVAQLLRSKSPRGNSPEARMANRLEEWAKNYKSTLDYKSKV